MNRELDMTSINIAVFLGRSSSAGTMALVSFFYHTTHLLKIKFLINLLFSTALAVEDDLHCLFVLSGCFFLTVSCIESKLLLFPVQNAYDLRTLIFTLPFLHWKLFWRLMSLHTWQPLGCRTLLCRACSQRIDVTEGLVWTPCMVLLSPWC